MTPAHRMPQVRPTVPAPTEINPSSTLVCGYSAITALGRVLIEIMGAEHRTGRDILVVAGEILLLSFAVLVLRFGSYRFPSDSPAADLAKKQSERALIEMD